MSVDRNVKLKIEVIDATTKLPGSTEITVCRDLPADVAAALVDDLVAMGRAKTSPYRLMRDQLDDLARLADAETDPKKQQQLWADRQFMLNGLRVDTLSGDAGRIASMAFLAAGRATPEGLCREIVARAKAAGAELKAEEVYAVIVPGNAAEVLRCLRKVLGEVESPLPLT